MSNIRNIFMHPHNVALQMSLERGKMAYHKRNFPPFPARLSGAEKQFIDRLKNRTKDNSWRMRRGYDGLVALFYIDARGREILFFCGHPDAVLSEAMLYKAELCQPDNHAEFMRAIDEQDKNALAESTKSTRPTVEQAIKERGWTRKHYSGIGKK